MESRTPVHVFTPTVNEFRESFPVFTLELFPDARVAFWLALAGKQLDPVRWDGLFAPGVCLYVAHQLTLEATAGKQADGSGGMDAAAGPVTAESKTVGSVSHSISRGGAAAAGAANLNAGHWNLTIYGQQYWQLVQMVGAGGLHI